MLPDAMPFTQNPSVDEVDEAEVLQQVVLDGGAGDQDPSLGLHGVQGLVCLVVSVLKSVSLQHKPQRCMEAIHEASSSKMCKTVNKKTTASWFKHLRGNMI